MLRCRSKQALSLKDRLASFAKEVREKAAQLQPGSEQTALLEKARQADAAAQLVEWADSKRFRRQNSAESREQRALGGAI
jgi:hypothetical protein